MKIAFTISSYALTPFVELGIKQLQKISPESSILVSDDRSEESDSIKDLCAKYSVAHICSRVKSGHFLGDVRSIVNSLAFGEAQKADIAVKLSQRLILRLPEAVSVIKKAFEDSSILVASPGRPSKILTAGGPAAQGFSKFAILTDITMFRVGCEDPQKMSERYRHKCATEHFPWSTFIEAFIDDYHVNIFPSKTVKVPELTDPTDNPIYLRRYQASDRQYAELARENGLGGVFPTGEWAALEGRNYICKPPIV